VTVVLVGALGGKSTAGAGAVEGSEAAGALAAVVEAGGSEDMICVIVNR
jgi:hypothetical protein